MGHSIREIAEAIGARAHGDVDIRVARVAEPAEARADDLALAMRPDYAEGLSRGQARAAMLWEGADWQAFGLSAAITASRPRFAMSGLSALMDRARPQPGQGVHPSSVVDPAAQLAPDVTVGPLAVVCAGAEVGPGGVIGAQCFVGEGARIGPSCLLHAGVRIGAGVAIGARFVAHPGAVVGADGFSFVTPEESAVERARDTLGDASGAAQGQAWARIHSLGGVRIGDDVELGANSCIDRGTVRDTVVGNGVKFDNLAQIGHNVVIGNDCMICAQVGVAGSSRIGNNVVLGGQTGVSDNLTIGDNVITGGATKVLANVPAGRVMLGYPAMKMDNHVEVYKGLRRLPRLYREVAQLRDTIARLTRNG
jgi:UDP-3-O-[3-hydroxymyristoyl] glucosamine N-acyltransferase